MALPFASAGARAQDSPAILIFATTWWPLSARLAVRLRDLGGRVSALVPQHHAMHAVQGLSAVHWLRPLSVARSMEDAVVAARPDLIVPTDDAAVWLLHDLAARRPEYAGLIERSIGSPAHYAQVRSRTEFLGLAQSLGICCCPPTVIADARQVEAMAREGRFPTVLKYDGTSGGYGVVIARDAEELREGYRKLLRYRLPLRRVKRLLIDGEYTALYQPGTFPPDEMTQQVFIPGTAANGLFVAQRGEIVAGLQVRVARTLSATGAAVVVDRMEHPGMTSAARKIAAKLELSGFFGLDFILHEETGEPWLLEINPRATQLCSIALDPARNRFATLADAAYSLAVASHQDVAAAAPLAGTQPIHPRFAFFPQALTLAPDDPALASAVIDRPDEEPALVAELMRPVWPERRRWLRLYDGMQRRFSS